MKRENIITDFSQKYDGMITAKRKAFQKLLCMPEICSKIAKISPEFC